MATATGRGKENELQWERHLQKCPLPIYMGCKGILWCLSKMIISHQSREETPTVELWDNIRWVLKKAENWCPNWGKTPLWKQTETGVEVKKNNRCDRRKWNAELKWDAWVAITEMRNWKFTFFWCFCLTFCSSLSGALTPHWCWGWVNMFLLMKYMFLLPFLQGAQGGMGSSSSSTLSWQ